MRAEEWFALALRVIGVIQVLYGVGYLFDSSLFRLGYFTYPDTTFGYYLIAGIAYTVVGLCLIRFTPPIVDFVYPPETDEESELDEEETDEEET